MTKKTARAMARKGQEFRIILRLKTPYRDPPLTEAGAKRLLNQWLAHAHDSFRAADYEIRDVMEDTPK